jgi:hypothetical protein
VPKGPKFKLLSVGLVAFLIFAIWSCLKSATPESEFKKLFADLSINAPEYQTLHNFARPIDTVKGDYFTADFQQSEQQFRDFLARIKVSEHEVSSKDGAWIKADSKINPKYPWMLNIQAKEADWTNNTYQVHIEGREPYD